MKYLLILAALMGLTAATPVGVERLRLVFGFFTRREKRRRPLRERVLLGLLGGERCEDRLALGLAGLRRDVCGLHR